MNAVGTHVILELHRANPVLLDDLDYVRSTLRQAAQVAGATIIGETFHQFTPQGVTGAVIIAESHLCIHTWPEHAFAAADVFTCGDSFDPREAARFMISRFESQMPVQRELVRGLTPTPVGAASG